NSLYVLFSTSGFLSVLLFPLSVQWYPVVINITVIFFVLCVILLFKPNILYGHWNFNQQLMSVTGRGRLPDLQQELVSNLRQQIQDFIREEHYLNKNITVN